MTAAYAHAIELPRPLAAAIETLQTALAAEQMGIVNEVDVRATAAPQRVVSRLATGTTDLQASAT